MHIHLLENREPFGWAVFGGYWPRGAVRNDTFTLTDVTGQAVPLQSEVTARWPDGSVKWSRHTAPADRIGTACELLPAGEGTAFRGLAVREEEDGWRITGDRLRLFVPRAGDALALDCVKDGLPAFDAVYPALSLCHAEETELGSREETVRCPAAVRERTLECAGPLETVFRFDGVHLDGAQEKMPFRIRMTVRPDGEITFDDTFFYRGDPERDRLAAWGLRVQTRLKGTSYQRQIRFLTDGDVFRDNPTQLFYWRRHLDPALLSAQQRGETVPETDDLNALAMDLPRWDRFLLTQDSAFHYAIRKKAWAQGCWLDGPQGRRAPGAMTVSDPERSLSFHVRDFWEKHPAGLETEGLSAQDTVCTVWFYAPGTEPFDFRHYDRRTYSQGNYEGFDYMRPDPNGIAVTCTAQVFPETGRCGDEAIRQRNRSVRKPPVCVGAPEYYHEYGAFGPWSLPGRDTETGRWIEKQLDAAVDFYLEEREARSWYGLFNFGDFMHTYEASRHMWRWDVGGYAWDNTELVPTYWLWLQFMRTGSEKVFALAEALSRHAADVDMYHFGPMKGLGSRHNVRHWGCPCKEPRVSMAGHHRPLYYLTGCRRTGDCMEDSLGAAASLRAMPWYVREDGSVRLRSGPDWAALVSDWMTAYERTLDDRWKDMILQGISDLQHTPLGLSSGPEFGFEPETGHLLYEGEADHPESMHLQACMGGTGIWLETADMLELPELKDMVAKNGRYFWLPEEERMKESGGLLRGRQFGSPIYSAEMQAWAARTSGDREMARSVWVSLLALLYREDRLEGFTHRECYAVRENGEGLWEIPWITTNFTAQWCLKAIITGALIPDDCPGTLTELNEALRAHPSGYRLYGA